MSGGAEPGDPHCPECDEPVGATASFCLHCEAALDDGGGTVETTRIHFGTAEAAPEATGGTTVHGGGNVVESPSPERDDGSDERGWFHFDSLAITAATAAVGVVAGLVVGGALVALVRMVTNGTWVLLVGAVAGVNTSLYATRARSAYRSVQRASVLAGGVVVVAPAFWYAAADGGLGVRVFLFAVIELVAVPIALLLVAFGRRVGEMAAD